MMLECCGLRIVMMNEQELREIASGRDEAKPCKALILNDFQCNNSFRQ